MELVDICFYGPFYVSIRTTRPNRHWVTTYELQPLGGYCVEPYGHLAFDVVNDLRDQKPTVESEWDRVSFSGCIRYGTLADHMRELLAPIVQTYDAEGEIPVDQYQAAIIDPFLASNVEEWLREMGHGSIGNRVVQMQNVLDDFLHPIQEIWDFIQSTRSMFRRICRQQCRCESAGGASWLEVVGAIQKAQGLEFAQAYSLAAARAREIQTPENMKQAQRDSDYSYPGRQAHNNLDTMEAPSSNPALTIYREECSLGEASCKTPLDCSDGERCVARSIENRLVLGVSSVTTWAAVCALLPVSKGRLGGRDEQSIPSTGNSDKDGPLSENPDWSCPCNETYVSDACCYSDSGMVYETLELKRGVLFLDNA